MAGDWIKMRTDLYRDPKVIVMADLLMDTKSDLGRFVNQNLQRDMAVTRNVTRCAVVGALVSVWGVSRHQGYRDGVDLRIDSVTLSVIDDIADIPGFGAAMEEAGWVEQDDAGLLFPRFYEEYNIDPANDEKAKHRERQRRYRERKRQQKEHPTSGEKRDVTVTSQSDTEKRRERDLRSTTTTTLDLSLSRNGLPKDLPTQSKGRTQAGRVAEITELANRIWPRLTDDLALLTTKDRRAIWVAAGSQATGCISEAELSDCLDATRRAKGDRIRYFRACVDGKLRSHGLDYDQVARELPAMPATRKGAAS